MCLEENYKKSRKHIIRGTETGKKYKTQRKISQAIGVAFFEFLNDEGRRQLEKNEHKEDNLS